MATALVMLGGEEIAVIHHSKGCEHSERPPERCVNVARMTVQRNVTLKNTHPGFTSRPCKHTAVAVIHHSKGCEHSERPRTRCEHGVKLKFLNREIGSQERVYDVGHRASSCQGNYCVQVVDQLCHEFEREVSQMTQDALKK